MYTLRRWIPALLAVMMAAGTAFCDDAVPAKYYKLEFVVKEVEGTKVLNSRSYSILTSDGDKSASTIRAESKVPWVSKQGPSTQFQQINVGLRVDIHGVKEILNRLSFNIVVDLTSMAEADSAPLAPVPVTRQNTWNSALAVPFKKPTVVFTSDVADAKRQMQVEVTATPLP
jgi:hypothetical protein